MSTGPAPLAPAAGSATARGILLMIAAIFAFSVMDVMVKALAQRADTVMALWARYAGQMALVTLVVLPRLAAVARTRYPRLQLLRSALLLGASGFMFFAISRIGLAEATAIMATNPVLITLGAALFLGERLGLRRLLGIAAALAGALLIIRPGSAVFTPDALLPLAAAACFSAYALVTRFVGRDEDAWTSLLYTALVGTLVLSVLVPFRWVAPDGITLMLLLGIGAVGGAGQLLLIRALMTAEAGTLAPFSYAGVLFATTWGILLFAEYPDAVTLAGALVIVSAGLYVWHRETRVPRTRAR